MGASTTGDGQDSVKEVSVTVENIGGIDRASVTFLPGVTVLTGRNATNRTSMLRALADALGGSPARIKSDADRGMIELTMDGEIYTREYERQNGGLSSQGVQFSDRRDLVDLFVCLLADNAARQAVERGDELREIIMEPVDVDQIQREIRQLESEREQIDDRVSKIERDLNRLPTLEERRTNLRAKREDIETSIEDVQSEIENHETTEEETERAEELLEELNDLRQELSSVESQIRHQETQLEEAQAKREDLLAELDEHHAPRDELESVEEELHTKRRQKRRIEATIDDLQRIVSFNEKVFSGDVEIGEVDADDDILDELDPTTQSVECWTCGSHVERSAIDARLDEFRSVIDARRERQRELEASIQNIEAQARDLRRSVEKQNDLEDEIDELGEEITVREDRRDELGSQRAEIEASIEEVESRVEETEELRGNDILEAYERLSELEYERGTVEQELSEMEAEMEEIESLEEERERLEDERSELVEEIISLRSSVDEREAEAVDQFNEHIDAILDLLEYENVARVWIERITGEGTRDDQTAFDLHIVRQSDDDAYYEDTADTLSESEREIIGLVVGLAGYLVHEVYEEVPFVLLDSLEAIDAQRIELLVDYFSEFTQYLFVALLPEDAEELPDSYDYVTPDALSA